MKKSHFLTLSAVVLAISAGGWIALDNRKAAPANAVSVSQKQAPAAGGAHDHHAHSDAPGFDRRETGVGRRDQAVLTSREERRRAAVELQNQMPLVRVDFDERLGSPAFVGSPSQFLSVPPERVAAYAADDAHRVAKAFMTEHAALFGGGPELLDEALVSKDYVTPHNGLRTTVWQQEVDGVRVFESTLQAHVTSKGELVNIASRMVPDARKAAETGTPEARKIITTPPVAATRAVSLAAATFGDKVAADAVVSAGPTEGPSHKQKFEAPSLTDVSTEFVWLPQDESAMHLCWEVIFTSRAHGEMYRTLVDAATGDAVLQQRLTEYISPASYRVFTGDSPTPMSPGHATPLAAQPAAVARQLVTLDALDTTASPNGWIDDGVTETRGNNVDAHLDVNADNVADTPRPQGSGTARVFDPPLDLTQAPNTYGNAAVVDLFYWNNLIHDRYHALGFTEAAGNFQMNNFGRGGKGNDPVQADAQDGSGTNNANFSTPADGSPGRMQMYKFTGPNPDRDGDFDHEIVIHEYTHGLSNRLVGGGVGISALQSRGMGEGWSDFYALCLLSEPGDDPNGAYAKGAYATYQFYGLAQNYYFGIRRYPYSTDMSKNPLTFKDIDPGQASTHAGVPESPEGGGAADQVHNQGEVWCVTLWDVRANLVAKHGAVVGNERVLQLVTDGMKLAPANPNFVQARDAILQADLVLSGGKDRQELWAAFAKRGLGAGASSPASGTTSGLVESHDLPDTLSVTPSALATTTGPIGGPFTPALFPYTLYNSGTSTMNWTVGSSAGWLAFSETSGSLAAGGKITLEASLNAAAATLQAGPHVATVTFANHSTGISQVRTVALQVDYLFVPVFQDGFESGSLDPAYWTVTGTGPHRTKVTTENGPHNGTSHLTMDSSKDETYARNEATLSLNLTGRSNLVLRFRAKMFSDEPHSPPGNPFTGGADFDGVAISADGTNWHEIQQLRSLDDGWQQLSVDLDAALAAHGLAYGSDFKIRFNHYDNYAISTDGFAFDDVVIAEAVNRRLQVNVAGTVTEGRAPLAASVTVTPAPVAPLTVTLASSDATEAAVPASATIPAGAGGVAFTISFPDDSELDGTQQAMITAQAETFVSGAATIAVHDTESAVISLDIPANAAEGGGAVTGTVNLSAAPDRNVRVALSSGEIGEVIVPASVEVPAGQTSVPFVITAVDDVRIDGPVNVTVTAHVENWTDGSAVITIADNETRSLAISAPDDLREGDPVRTATVSLSGTLATDLLVSLASTDTAEATVPASVMIYAGQSHASFSITVADDALRDGTKHLSLVAAADGFPEISTTTRIADNDAASFSLSPIATQQVRNASFPIIVTARDIHGDAIPNYAGTLSFTAAAPGGGTIAISATPTDGFVNGVWTGNAVIDVFADGIVLTAGAGDISVTSNPFNVRRGPMSRLGWATVPSPRTIDTPFNVSLRAEDAGGNLVDDFTGSVSLAALSPGPLAPTGTGQSLAYDLNPFYTQSRFQCIYTPEEIGQAGRLTGLQFNMLYATNVSLDNLTIRVKHTPLRTYGSSGKGWETSGWTTVHSQSTVIGNTGWFNLPFSTSFDYDGTSNLMVDISFNRTGSPAPGLGYYFCTNRPEIRKLSYQTINGTDPLGWSDQTTPARPSNQLPNLRFTSYNVPSPIRPATTGAFVGGQWNGSVSVPFLTNGLQLLASDGTGREGKSNEFAVVEAASAIRTGTITENFEKNPLTTVWTFTGTNNHRTLVSTGSSPHGGLRHLVMDSSASPYSRNEATWTVDLRGLTGVNLKFWAKGGYNGSFSNTSPPSPFTNGADFDGVAVSANGTTWYEIQSLRTLGYNWTPFSINLDSVTATLGLAYNSSFKIRFNHYGYAPMPYSGLAVDDIEITSTPSPHMLKVTGPAQMREGDAPVRCAVILPFAAAADTVISLASSAPAKASVPGQITVPAGRLSAAFTVSSVNDPLADGPKSVAITASSPIFPAGELRMVVNDDDQSSLTFTVPATTTVEGAGTIQATVGIGTPAAAPAVFNVTSSNTQEISVPSTVTIPQGATTATLPLTVVNDAKADGTRTATITVSAAGSLSQSVTITVEDNETLDLQLFPSATPPPVSVMEGAGGVALTALLPGTVDTATTLTFGSSAPAKIIPPEPAVIQAGGTSVNLNFTIVDDQAAQPSEPVTLTVSAPGFNSGSYLITFLDNDPDHFTIAPIASPQVRGAPIPLRVAARDVNGAALAGFTGPVTLGGNGPSVSPPSLDSFTAGVSTTSARVNEIASGVVLTVSDARGHSVSSNPFDVGAGTFQQLVWAPIPATRTPASSIPVTLKAADAGGHADPSVNEPVTVQALAPVPAAIIGSGVESTSSFLYTYHPRTRSEVLYLASEIGPARMLAGIALHAKSGVADQVLSNFTIRLKTTTRTEMEDTGWEGGGWTVVHSSQQKLTANGWITFFFDAPFEYDGRENLLVDFSYNNVTSPYDSVSWSSDFASTYRVRYTESSFATDPLTWSGTDPASNINSSLPKARFLTLQPVPANLPAAPAISAGTWNGVVSFGGAIDRVFLDAVDASGRHGISNAFRIASSPPAATQIPFTEGFDTGTLSGKWSVSSTENGRVRVLSSYTPHTGGYHAVLDSSSGDARAELTLPLDLTGSTGVTLVFWAKRFDSVNDGPPSAPFTGGADFDGVAISADGISWHEVQPLRGMTLDTWTKFTVDLDAAIGARGLAYTPDFRIRFNHYGNDYAPYDGIAIDDVSVTGDPINRLAITLPASIMENSAGAQGSVTRNSAVATNTTVALSSASPLALGVPASVVIPAGQTSATFTLVPVDNTTVGGPFSVSVTGSIGGIPAATAAVELRDDDTGTLTLSAPPSISESVSPVEATLTISPPAAGNLTISLTSSLPGALQVPASVRLLPGQTAVTFPLTTVNDSRQNGTRNVTLGASLDGWPAATASTTVIDDDDGSPYWPSGGYVNEGASTTVTLYTDGTLSSALEVSLTSADTSRLTLPATVTVPAGASSVSVKVTALNNNTVEGSKTVSITANAAGFAPVSRDVTINDNDPHHFVFAPISTQQARGVAFPVRVSAYDVDDRLMTNFLGNVPLGAAGDAGDISRSPTSITFASGVWSGNVTLSALSQNVRLRVAAGAAYFGVSDAFNVIPGGPASYVWSAIGSSQTVGQPFTATITARDENNNAMTGHSGYVTIASPGSGGERTIGTGTATTTSFPLASGFHDQRTQVVYFPSEVGAAGKISSVSLYVTSYSSQILNAWTIRMKHSSLGASGFDNTGWTTVYSSNQTISQTGWVTFNLSTPFVYNGTDNLFVDFSFNNTSSSYSGAVRSFSGSTARTVFSYSNSTNGNPLTWSGSFYVETVAPQIRFNAGLAPTQSTVNPGVVLLTNGTWTGSLHMGTASPGVSLTATDFSGVTAKSNSFTVVTAPDDDGDALPNSWETAHNLAIGSKTGDEGAMGDPDEDGVPNLLEYAFNLDPLAASASGLPFSVKTANPVDGEEYLEVTYRRRIGAAGISYIIETSGDCITWSPATTQYETAAGPLATGDGVSETVTVRILPKITATPVKFARLRVAAP